MRQNHATLISSCSSTNEVARNPDIVQRKSWESQEERFSFSSIDKRREKWAMINNE